MSGTIETQQTPNFSVAGARGSLPRRVFRKVVHFFSYHFILNRSRLSSTSVSGLTLTVEPTVFHPKIFLTSKFFAEFLQRLDLTGKSAVEIGTGSGILALSAAKAGAASVLALDINPAAVRTAAANAKANGLELQVKAMVSDLFSSVPLGEQFDIMIASPPSFAGEPRSMADRAWHAGPGYRDIAPLFEQARQRISADGSMYLLLSSDSDIGLFDKLIEQAGFASTVVDRRSIWVETFILYELKPRAIKPADVGAVLGSNGRQP
jgi:release factor glutamine methyltransferase